MVEMERRPEWWAIFMPELNAAWRNPALVAASCFEIPLVSQELIERLHEPPESARVHEAVLAAWATGDVQVVQYVAIMRRGWTRLESRLFAPRCGKCPSCKIIIFNVRALGPAPE